MKIKTRLQISVILTIVLVAAASLFIFSAYKEMNEWSRKEITTDRISKNMAELKIVTHEYLLHPGERSLMQWKTSRDSLAKLLAEEVNIFKDLGEKDALKKILESFERFSDVFAELAAIPREEREHGGHHKNWISELKVKLTGDLLVESQAIVSLIFVVNQAIQTKLVSVQRETGLLTVILFIVLAVLVSAISLWISRSIGAPITRLEEGIRIIGGGDLNHKVGTDAKDEIGWLSRAFDNMTQNLKKSTASIDDLNREIDERRKMEKALLESEKKARQYLDIAGVIFVVLNKKGDITLINQRGIEILGYRQEELIGKNWFKTCLPERMQRDVLNVYHQLIKGEVDSVEYYENPVLTKDGKERIIAWHNTVLRNPDDEIVGVLSSGEDINDRKHAEQQLSEHLENLEAIVEERTKELSRALYDTEKSRDNIDGILKSIADGLIVTDIHSRIVLMNRAAEDLLGARFSEVIGRPIDVAIKDETLRQRFKTSLEEREPGYKFEFELPGKNAKHPRIIRARTSEIKDKAGEQTGIITIIYDVTLEREVDRMKTEFISAAAHQLRTPLTSIQGFSELLMTKDDINKEEQKDFFSHINKQSVNLANIINDLLDISRIESGIEFTLRKVSCDINEIIREKIKYFQASEPKRQFDIILPKEPLELMVDKDKIEQVLENLLSNAVKYSPEGSAICLTAKRISEAEIEVSVADQGIGMSHGQVEKIFDKFYRADTYGASISGIGLGMSIVKNYVEAHEGKVWVESEPGKGTTVKFTIPI